MSITIGHRLAAGGRGRPSARVAIALRVRVFMRRGVLDQLLAAGADPCWDRELALRAAHLIAPRRRRALAQSLVRAVRDAHSPPRWSCAAPIARSAARATTPELRALAASLTQEAAPAPQGVALAQQLLREPGSPLYAPGDERALRESVRLTQRALRHDAIRA
ncbi:MAG TPA: hypothetical protein VFM57_16630 [Thermoleophilaceae bacterium]|nr:hypothetical protein [Thermoleophilaceae bacterium]